MPDGQNDPNPRRLLRRALSGVVVADPLAVRVLYVVDPATGEPVVVCRADAAETDDWVLFVPDESEGALHLAGAPEALDPERDAACDRWRAYHGSPEAGRFFRLAVQWGRRGGESWDADDLRAPNGAAAVEARLLRMLNADQARVGAIAARAAGWPGGEKVSPGVAVGVDDLGLDVRVGRQIVRVEHERAPASPEEVVAMVERLFRGGGA